MLTLSAYNIVLPVMNVRKIALLCLAVGIGVGAVFLLLFALEHYGAQKTLKRLREETPMARLLLVKELLRQEKPWGIRVAWLEWNPLRKEKMQPRAFDIEGDKVYVDALVVKFLSKYVEAGDPWRGKSIALFYRLFGEYQRPIEGYPLNRVLEKTWGYKVRNPLGYFEGRILEQFWNYADQPALAQRDGVDCVFGEAVMVKPQLLHLYTFSLAHNGAIVVRSEESPWLGVVGLRGDAAR